MSDQTGNTPQDGDQPGGQQPPPYPPPQQSPYGQPPSAPYGQPPQQQPTSPQPQYGQPTYGQPEYGQPTYDQPQYGGYGPAGADPDKRPTTVTVAGVITLVLSGLTLAMLTIGLLALGLASEQLVDQLGDDPALANIDTDSVVAVLWVMFGIFIIWSAIAMVLAVLAMRRSNAARIGLVVSAGVTALLSLFAITSGASAVTLVGAVAVIVCLFTGGAGEWYARSGGGPGHHGMPPPVA